MKLTIGFRVYDEIYNFYMNVYRTYRHTWGLEEIHNLIDKTFDSLYRIENGLLRRKPTISRWNGLYMATTKDGKWNFAYRIEGNTIYVEDACHSQNMHESKKSIRLTKSELRGMIVESIKRVLNETCQDIYRRRHSEIV